MTSSRNGHQILEPIASNYRGLGDSVKGKKRGATGAKEKNSPSGKFGHWKMEEEGSSTQPEKSEEEDGNSARGKCNCPDQEQHAEK